MRVNWGVAQEGQELKNSTRGSRTKEQHNAKGSKAKEQPKKVKN